MDLRAEKLAKARKKLRDHQEKKTIISTKDLDNFDSQIISQVNNNVDNSKLDDLLTDEFKIAVAPESSESEVSFKQDKSVNDFLLADKTKLELQLKDLNTKLYQLELLRESEVKENDALKDKVNSFQFQLNTEMKKNATILEENTFKNNIIEQLQIEYKNLTEEKVNLLEQLEVTKVMLKSKEAENLKLQNDINDLNNQLEATKLQIQQISNISSIQINDAIITSQDNEALTQKINFLQQQIETLQKERDNINSHYEHYVKDLNEQLKNENLNKEKYYEELQKLQQRESSLIEQISEMEIRLQSFNNIREKSLESHSVNILDLQEKYKDAEVKLQVATSKYEDLHKQYVDSLATIKSLTEVKEDSTCDHDNISMSQLNADIASDKVALQTAIQQNKKLKQDVEDLELVVVKMTQDKLELTEILNHEKKLNKDLILKLSDIEESTKNMNDKLRAKDDEMMRLQSGYREIENKHGKLLHDLSSLKERTTNMCYNTRNDSADSDNANNHEMLLDTSDNNDETQTETDDNKNIPNTDAMYKLQERFLKIMNEVANLSDEKHRLEHIITQLQNETDTICEYVALYQQQRSLLKKREEERNHQISLFQKECDQLKQHVEALRYIILQIIDDPKLTSYFKNEGIEKEIIKAKHLLDVIQNNCLIEAKFHRLDLNIFYPCNCCSGQLIDV